jgi:glyoxylase-like metal-dependent hydrolase (beta-lactamase superfamily II)
MMRRRIVLASLAATVLCLAACGSLLQPDAAPLLRQAEQAMGGIGLNSIRFSAQGGGALFGQAFVPGMAWPRLNYTSLTRLADYQNGALREEFGRARAEPNGGGALPLMGLGEQRGVGLLRGNVAWNLAGPAATAAPLALDERIHDLWTTPHGALKAALRNGGTLAPRIVDGRTVQAVSFTEPGRFSATLLIGATNLVERIESRRPHPVTGDTDVVTTFLDYKDFGGVMVPTRIRQSQGGFEVLDVAVREVQTNPASDIVVPDTVRNFSERVVAEEAADGVWYLAGGSHHSVLIEMSDHLVLVESPLYDARAAAVLAEARKLVPGKPIRFVINSHHHFDHAGGLRAAVAQGATILTSAVAKGPFERAFSNPNRISPDLLARSGRSANIIGVRGIYELSDDTRRIEVHEIDASIHAAGLLMVYLPKERILIEADAYTPQSAGMPPPTLPNANNLNLVQNIERLGLSVDLILPLHGRMVPMRELYAAIGRRP